MKLKRRNFLKILASIPVIGYVLNLKQEEENKAEIEKLVEVVRLKHGLKLSEEQMGMLREEIEANIRRRERLFSYKLSNSDEPDFKFQVSNTPRV